MNSLASQNTIGHNKPKQHRKNAIHMPLASLAMAIAAINYAPVVTAQSDQESMRFLEEVVVTARRREESQQDVPIAVTSMGQDFLREQNITQIEDLGTHVPSVRISSAGTGTNQPLVTIRGQRPSEAAIQLDPAAPIYFNDVVMLPSVGTNLAMYDLQNVQVLKGPQGTLFGRNSTGGALLMTPTRPGDALGGYVEAKMGNYDLMSIEGAIDVPITDQLSMRLVGRKVERDGYQENIADTSLNGNRARGEDSEGLRLSVSYLGDRLSNLTVLSYDKNESGSPVAQTRGVNTSTQGGGTMAAVWPEYLSAVQEIVDRDDPWKYKSDVDSTDKVENTFASNTVEFELSDNLSVKNILGYRKVEYSSGNDADGTLLPISGSITSNNSPGSPDYTDSGYGLGITGADHNPTEATPTIAEQFTAELQLLGTAFDERLDWIAGAYWSQMEGTSNQSLQQIGGRWVGIPAFGGFPFPGVYEVNSTTALNTGTGLFAEGTYRFSDEWSLTAGLRQSWDERELTVRKFTSNAGLANLSCAIHAPGVTPSTDPRNPNANALPSDACERTVEEEFDDPTWRLSLNYMPSDAILLYGSVSTGYKAGGFNSRGTDDSTLQPFDPEAVTTYELGSKIDWSLGDVPVRTNAALYWQAYEDIQQTKPIDVGGALATQTVNAAKADIRGFEVDITAMPTDNLSLSLSYSFVDAEYKENESSVPDGAGGLYTFDTSDNDFVYIPENTMTAAATYTFPMDASLGEMSVTASYYWQDDMTTHALAGDFSEFQSNGIVNPAARWTDDNVELAESVSQVDSYGVWNLRYDWRNIMGSNFDFAAYMNNVADEEYVLGGLNVIDVFWAA
ncbi:TonB-dependent receptor, partial [Pseudomaricurvus sp.]|uniref:TonB-dependent receptor n=1 Tax=Pseudomaricurvus sp. TaxID=2004510 RepID=UPI003F6CA383